MTGLIKISVPGCNFKDPIFKFHNFYSREYKLKEFAYAI